MKKIVFVIVSIILILVGVYFVFFNTKNNDLSEKYTTVSPKIEKVEKIVSANGVINPIDLISIGSQVSGTVNKINVTFNSKVKKGDILMTLDGTIVEAQQRSAKSALDQANVQVRQTKLDFSRFEGLFEAGYVSNKTLDDARFAYESAQANAQVRKGDLERLAINSSFFIIKSPIDGIVIDKKVEEGQTVTASLQTPDLVKIAGDLTKVQINAYFSESDIGNIKMGMDVNFKVDAYPNIEYKGVISEIRMSPITTQNVVTYDVVILSANKDLSLLPGMTAYVSVKTKELLNELSIPTTALKFRVSDDDKVEKITCDCVSVFLLEKNELKQKEIKVKLQGMNNIAVEGLLSTDNVVIAYKANKNIKSKFRLF